MTRMLAPTPIPSPNRTEPNPPHPNRTEPTPPEPNSPHSESASDTLLLAVYMVGLMQALPSDDDVGRGGTGLGSLNAGMGQADDVKVIRKMQLRDDDRYDDRYGDRYDDRYGDRYDDHDDDGSSGSESGQRGGRRRQQGRQRDDGGGGGRARAGSGSDAEGGGDLGSIADSLVTSFTNTKSSFILPTDPDDTGDGGFVDGIGGGVRAGSGGGHIHNEHEHRGGHQGEGDGEGEGEGRYDDASLTSRDMSRLQGLQGNKDRGGSRDRQSNRPKLERRRSSSVAPPNRDEGEVESAGAEGEGMQGFGFTCKLGYF